MGLLLAAGPALATMPAAGQGGLRTTGAASTASLEPVPSVAGLGTVVGYVVGAGGHPEAGALVELQSQSGQRLPVRALSTLQGVVSFAGLAPGGYVIRAGKGERIADRQQVEVRAAQRTLVWLDLPQLLNAMQVGAPLSAEDQQFRWAVRQATDLRPVLRWTDPAPVQALAAMPLQGSITVFAGGDPNASDSGTVATAFEVNTEMADRVAMNLNGNVGTSAVGDGTDFNAVFRSTDADSQTRLSVGLQQIGTPSAAAPALRTLTFNYADGVNDGGLELHYGALFNTVTLNDSTHTFNPYLRAIYHLSPHAQVEYRAAMAVPPLAFDADHAEMANPIPRVSLVHGDQLRVEQAHHQEILYADNLSSDDSLSGAVFVEHYAQAAVYGVGNAGVEAATGGLLPAFLGNMYSLNGGSYGGSGYRLVYGHRFGEAWTGAVAFSAGSVLAPDRAALDPSDLPASLRAARAHAWTAKITGELPGTHTHLVCSYRQLSRPSVTGVDLYDDGAAQSDAYANLSLKQPLPQWASGGNSHVAALLDVHNLFAQGYLPMGSMGGDGQTLYLVQAARSVQGGLTVSF